MGLLDKIRHREKQAAAQDRDGVGAAIERLLALHPQLHLARHGRKRLAPAVATSFAHVRVFSLVRFARTSLLPETSVFEEAEQLLSSGLRS